MAKWVMTLTSPRQLAGGRSDMRISAFALFRGRAERKLNKIARYCYGDEFTVVEIARK